MLEFLLFLKPNAKVQKWYLLVKELNNNNKNKNELQYYTRGLSAIFGISRTTEPFWMKRTFFFKEPMYISFNGINSIDISYKWTDVGTEFGQR